jgi:Uma2 family endonuclease
MSAFPQRLTPEEYLAIERAAEFKSEYYNGRMYAMAGTSYRHALLVTNLVVTISSEIGGRPCAVISTDLRVRVQPGGLYTYLDIVVFCGDSKFVDTELDTLLNPTVIIEVLSPFTEAYDRGFKASQYRTLASLQEYALVSQTEPRIEVFRRQEGREWLFSESVGLDATCRLESVGCSIALSAVYRKITFTAEDPGASRPSAGG